MSIQDFRELGDSPNRPSASPKGSILQAFPPELLDVHFRNGYIFRLDPCNVVTGYSPEYCDAEHAPKMDPSFYGPNVQVPVRMLQAAFSCSAVGATEDELRHWAKSPLKLRLWANVDTTLTQLLEAQAVNETPFPLPAALVLAKAAQYLATFGHSGTGVIYGSMEWLSQLGMDYLITWDEEAGHYKDAVGNIIIPSSVDNDRVYAFDSFVDIKTSTIQILDEFMPAQRTNNDRVVRAEQLYTVAIGPCVAARFDVGITATGDTVIVEPGVFPLNVNIISPNPLPVTFAGAITVNQGTSPWVIGDGGGSITVDGPLTDVQLRATPVPVSGTVALDAGTLAALESITVQNPAGAGAVNIQDGGNSITVDAVAFDIRHLTFANDKVDVSGSTVTLSGPISTTIDFSYAEDSVHVSGDKGAFVLAVRNDAAAVLTSGNGDYSPIAVDSAGRVGISDLGGSITVDGTVGVSGTVAVTQSTSPWVVSGTVTANQGTNPWITSLDAPTLAALESITVQNPSGAGAVNIQDGGNSITVDGSVSIIGTVAVTQSTSPWVVSGTVTDSTAKAEDSVAVNADPGFPILGVRNDAAATKTSNDGDYSMIATDAAGRVGIADLGGSISIDDNGGSITVDGTVAVTQSTSPWVTSLDATTLAALESITVQNPGGASAVNIQDGGNSITVDGTVSISGTVGVTQSTSPWVVSGTVSATTNFSYAEDAPHVSGDPGAFVLAVRNDANAVFTNTNGDYSPIAVNSAGAVAINDGGNSITVDGTVSAIQSGAWTVAVNNASGAAAVNIQDGGNSITVDGSVSITGSVTVVGNQTPGDTVSNPTDALDTRDFIEVWNGTTWDRVKTPSADVTNANGIISTGGYTYAGGTAYSRIREYPTADAQVNTGIQAVGLMVSAAAGVTSNRVRDPSTDAIGVGTLASGNMGFNGSNWDRIRSGGDDTDNQAAISLGVIKTIGRTYVWDSGGGNWDRWTGSVSVSNGSGAAAVNIQDGGNSITVDGSVSITGTVAVTQSTSPWVVAEQSGTLAAGAETAVSNTAVQIIASNANRKKLIVQNTGTFNIRVGIAGVTNTTGARIVPNGTLLYEMPNCPTNAIFAIREGASDSIAFAEEIT